MPPIRVILVDDSAVVRHVLSRELGRDPALEIVGTAADPYEARDSIVRLSPDVVILDIQMPRMNGLTFLGKLMRHHPLPVIIVSSLTPQGSAMALQALELGAVGVFQKPGGDDRTVRELAQDLTDCIKAIGATPGPMRLPVQVPLTQRLNAMTTRSAEHIIAIGASTGGTQAIPAMLSAFPPVSPPILIVQHMPGGFTTSFAKRLTELTALDVREAEDGDQPRPGLALMAPGGRHMVLKKDGGSWRVRVYDGPLVRGHRPSVDVLFKSVASAAGQKAIGVLLTGMGADGSVGMLDMHNAGALTIAQDEASCVVFGMPAEAIRLGAATHTLAPNEIPATIFDYLEAAPSHVDRN